MHVLHILAAQVPISIKSPFSLSTWFGRYLLTNLRSLFSKFDLTSFGYIFCVLVMEVTMKEVQHSNKSFYASGLLLQFSDVNFTLFFAVAYIGEQGLQFQLDET